MSERIRGSSSIPLNAAGRRQAVRAGMMMRFAGGVDDIYSSDLPRADETARTLKRLNPDAKLLTIPSLSDWPLGRLEGLPVTPTVIDQIAHYVRNPNELPPGRGPKSTMIGESFNSFRLRILGQVQDLERAYAKEPNDRILAIIHRRIVKLLLAWAAKGFPEDKSIQTDLMLDYADEESEPGDLFCLKQGMSFEKVDYADVAQCDGVYFMRHGTTDDNS